jgi:aromatic ring hydroxylase
VPVHKVGESRSGIVVRGARILATLAPFADEIAVYPAHPLPAGAEAYALAFSIPVDAPGLVFLPPRPRPPGHRDPPLQPAH